MNRLRKAGYCFRNIPRENKKDGGTGIIYSDRYNPLLVSKGRHDVSFEFSQWQIKIGKKTVNILTVYRPPYSRGNLYTDFWFVEEFGDFLGERLKNTKAIMGDFNFHVEDVKDSENLAFQDLLKSSGLIQYVGCLTHQSGHTLDFIITKEEDTLCISDPVDKFYISHHSFVHSEIRVNRQKVIRRTISTRRMKDVEGMKSRKS